ncbi:MAG: F0F1 ATP synthase subunit gamma [Sphingobium limneticum]
MSGRLEEVGRRITSVRQLAAVVNAMRGIAGVRAQQSRLLLPAVRAYAETAASAIGQARLLVPPSMKTVPPLPREKGIHILFGAEQGFAGAFPEMALGTIPPGMAGADLFVIGARTATLAAERGLAVRWHESLPSRAADMPRVVTSITDAIFDLLEDAGVEIAMTYASWTIGRGASVVHRNLMPFDPALFPAAAARTPSIINLPPAELLEQLVSEHLFAQLCEAGIETLAAENEARMATMASAKTNIDSKLTALKALERLTRQEEITAEVVELAAGARPRVNETTGSAGDARRPASAAGIERRALS